MRPDAPQLHAEAPGNITCRFRIRKGDMTVGWAQADVIVENFRAGVMDRLDLGYESLHERNRRLVYGAIAHLMKGDRAPVHAVDSLKTSALP